MGMHGYFHQVPATRLEELIGDPSLVMAELYPDDRDDGARCTVEKTWNAIQFMLQLLSQLGHFPEDSPYFDGGVQIGEPLSYDPAEYWTPEQVAAIAPALSEVSDEQLREAYRPDLMTEYNVYPGVWDRDDETEWNFQWIQEHFRSMVDYYAEAAANGNAILEYLG